MVRDCFRGLLSALLLAMVAAGGGRLPMVDALVFHEGVANPELFRSHFEASSGCHDDGCSVRSVAQESRLNSSLATPALRACAPEAEILPPATPAPPPAPTCTSHLSRAPPLSV
jgi:hypothetical protein